MSEYSTNENYAKAIRHKIASTAKSMLEGELSFLSGARILASLRHEFPSGADDRDFLVFVAVDSETDHFPLGEPCQHWDKQSLEQLQPEIELAEERARVFSSPACASLLNRFGE
ncbi:DUF2489 domain-containing protein [Herbaspirillum rubrisubalbicans]|uniref:DUF2489 domain-containing protein n=1 Tax=Herbaspirillum rubrisubalbicans TaxID=80842 RepID=UPI001E2A2F04|nr:DUF2489 domain-containing protein [Herbaspirillum rubrisubalbicans]